MRIIISILLFTLSMLLLKYKQDSRANHGTPSDSLPDTSETYLKMAAGNFRYLYNNDSMMFEFEIQHPLTLSDKCMHQPSEKDNDLKIIGI